MRKISAQGLERRDRRERLELWGTYGDELRCIGGHLGHGQYCCLRCGSSDPEDRCDKERVIRGKLLEFDENALLYGEYEIIGNDPRKTKKFMEAELYWIGDCPKCCSGVQVLKGEESSAQCGDCGQQLEIEVLP